MYSRLRDTATRDWTKIECTADSIATWQGERYLSQAGEVIHSLNSPVRIHIKHRSSDKLSLGLSAQQLSMPQPPHFPGVSP